jgi:hypothetical protein
MMLALVLAFSAQASLLLSPTGLAPTVSLSATPTRTIVKAATVTPTVTPTATPTPNATEVVFERKNAYVLSDLRRKASYLYGSKIEQVSRGGRKRLRLTGISPVTGAAVVVEMPCF